MRAVQQHLSSHSAVLSRCYATHAWTVLLCEPLLPPPKLQPQSRINDTWSEPLLPSLILTRIFRPQVYARPWNSFPPPQCVFSFFNRLSLWVNPAAPCMYILRLLRGWRRWAFCLFVCGWSGAAGTCYLVLGRLAATSTVCVFPEDQLVSQWRRGMKRMINSKN